MADAGDGRAEFDLVIQSEQIHAGFGGIDQVGNREMGRNRNRNKGKKTKEEKGRGQNDLRLNSATRSNYGWNIVEGNQCKSGLDCDTTGLIPPTHTYDHSVGSAVIGGFVYRGSAIPGLEGIYVFGDLATTHFWGLFYDSNGETRRETVAVARGGLLPPHVISQGNDGELYFMRAREMQTPRKIIPDSPPPPPDSSFP